MSASEGLINIAVRTVSLFVLNRFLFWWALGYESRIHYCDDLNDGDKQEELHGTPNHRSVAHKLSSELRSDRCHVQECAETNVKSDEGETLRSNAISLIIINGD